MAISKREGAGRDAKAIGHINEHRVADSLNDWRKGHTVDGASTTKVDILNKKHKLFYSMNKI